MGEDTSKTFPGFDFDTFDGCVASMGDEDGIDDPEAFCAWLEEEGKDALSDPHAEDVLTGLEVEFVSAVDTPAQDSEWVIAKNATDPNGDTHRWQSETPLLLKRAGGEDADEDTEKDGDERQIAFAPVLIPGEADKQGDVVPSPEIEKAAHRYLSEYRKVDSDHDLLEGKGKPVESWTAKTDLQFTKPDGSASREYPEGTWLMGIKFDDETWSRVKQGELNGLSIYGGAMPLDVESLLGKAVDAGAPGTESTATAKASDTDDTNQTSMSDEDTEKGTEGGGDADEVPDDKGETTSKQDLNAEQVSTMLAEFGSMVEDGTISRDATVEAFVRGLIENGAVEEGQVTNLSVFLGGSGGGGSGEDAETPEGPQGEDEGEQASDADDGVSLSADEDDAEKADDADEGDVEKGVTDAVDDDAPEWAQALASEVEDLRKQVEDVPSGARMDVDENTRLETIKSLFGVEDDEEAEVIRKGVVEQMEKADGDDTPTIDFGGITDGEDADAEASGSKDKGGTSGQTAVQNKRMAGLND